MMLHSSFNPASMSQFDLERTFVQREALADRLVELYKKSATTKSKHNVLLVGPRGIGKSHLCALVYHRLRQDDEIAQRLCIAYLREDEWGITSFLDLLLRISEAVLSELELPKPKGIWDDLSTKDKRASEEAVWKMLRATVRGRTLLVIAENLETLFSNIGEQGQRRWRSLMQNESNWALLTTTPALFPDISRQSFPFYGYFEVTHLRSLTLEEAVNLLEKLAASHGDVATAQSFKSPVSRARVRAVQHIAGGNHRIFVLFYEFLKKGDSDPNEMLPAILKTIDALTPYYQAKMERLSSQQQKIVFYLCQQCGLSTVKEIAKGCFASQQTAASQLKQLLDRRYVIVNRIGRESFYELAEPLMRICFEVKTHKNEPLRLLIEFLRYWFSRDELAAKALSSAQESARTYFDAALREYEIDSGHRHLSPEIANLCVALQRSHRSAVSAELAEQLQELSLRANDWSHYIIAAINVEKTADAISVLLGRLSKHPDDPDILFALGRAYIYSHQFHKGMSYLDRAAKRSPDKLGIVYDKAYGLSRMNRHDEAIRLLDTLIKANSYLSMHARIGKAKIQLAVGDPKGARRTLKPLLHCAKQMDDIYVLYGTTYAKERSFDRAEEFFKKATEAFPEEPKGWTSLAGVFVDRKEPKKAIETVQHALDLEPDDEDAQAVACYALFGLRDYDRAFKLVRNREILAHFIFHELSDLLKSAPSEPDIRKALIQWYKRFPNANSRKVLSGAFVQLVRDLHSREAAVQLTELTKWNSVMHAVFAVEPSFSLVLRVFDVFVRFKQTSDRRILLELPLEQRQLFEAKRTLQ